MYRKNNKVAGMHIPTPQGTASWRSASGRRWRRIFPIARGDGPPRGRLRFDHTARYGRPRTVRTSRRSTSAKKIRTKRATGLLARFACVRPVVYLSGALVALSLSPWTKSAERIQAVTEMAAKTTGNASISMNAPVYFSEKGAADASRKRFAAPLAENGKRN